MADQQPPPLTPQASAALAAFRQKYPGLKPGLPNLFKAAKEDPAFIKDYVELSALSGVAKGQPYEGWAIDPISGQFTKDSTLKDFAWKAALILGATATGGATLGALGAGGTAGVGIGETAAATGFGTTAAATAGGAGTIGSMLLPTGINAGVGLASNYMQNRSNNKATQMQIDAANRAAELEAQSAAEQLAFQREQEATRKKEWDETQAKNWQLEQDRLARQEPFRRAGANSLGQMLRPIAYSQRPGTLGAFLKR